MEDIKITCVNPNCDDTTDHLWINLQKGVYHCWKCDFSGRIVNNKSVINALKQTKSKKPIVRSFNSGQMEDSLKAIDPSKFVHLSTLKTNHQAIKYLFSRGVTIDVCYKMGGMYCPNDKLYGRIVFPIKDGNKIVGWQGRSVYGKKPKYLIFGKKSLGMYNMKPLGDYDKFIIIFEGIFDVLKVPDYGISILGKKLSDVQLRMLSTLLQVKTIFVMLDSDANAEELVMCRELSKWFKAIPMQLETGDPGNLTELCILDMCVRKL